MFPKRLTALAIAFVLLFSMCACMAEATYITDIIVSAAPVATATPEPTATPEATATPKPTVTPEPTATPKPTVTPEPTAKPGTTPVPYDGDYEIEVDLTNQITTVYRGSGRSVADIARQMICSTGEGDTTPLGEFTMPKILKEDEREEWYFIGKFQLYVQYASRIVDDILFHSLPSEQRGASPTEDSLQALGTPASHGCIRLRPADSRWIAENCPAGTRVHIFDDGLMDEALHNVLMKSSFDSVKMGYFEFLNGKSLYSVSSEGDDIAALQAKLNELGYECGETDGKFGAETHNAVCAWQQDFGYKPTGELTREDLNYLLRLDLSAMPTPKPDVYGRVKVGSSLALRSEPNAQSKLLDRLNNNTRVKIIEKVRGWYKVQVNGKTGYVGSNYIFID